MSSVGIVIATFGDPKWRILAGRAELSAENQTRQPENIILSHADTLQEARNYGADRCQTDHLIFLDADDEIEPGYVEAMLEGTGNIRRPSTRGVYEDGSIEEPPSMIPRRDINESNCIVIGAMVDHDLFDQAGGFGDYPLLEDWDLWLRCWNLGASVVDVPKAVYRIHVTPGSRNMAEPGLMSSVYAQIRRTSGGKRPWLSV